MKNRCQESSFHSFGFAIITVLAEVGSIWACLEKVLSQLSGSGLGLGDWAIWRGLELSTEGLISAWQETPHCSATFASWAGRVSSRSRREELDLELVSIFSRSHLGYWGGGIYHQASETIALTTVPSVWADYETSQTVIPDPVLANDPASSIPISHSRPTGDVAFPPWRQNIWLARWL